MRHSREDDVAKRSGSIVTDVTVLELDRKALQALARDQHVLVTDENRSILLYINGGDVDPVDISIENSANGKCNISIDAFGKLLRGDTMYWSDHGYEGGHLIIDSVGANIDFEHPDQKSEKLIKQDGW